MPKRAEETSRKTCFVCLAGLEETDLWARMKCDTDHTFHFYCLRKWIAVKR